MTKIKRKKGKCSLCLDITKVILHKKRWYCEKCLIKLIAVTMVKYAIIDVFSNNEKEIAKRGVKK